MIVWQVRGFFSPPDLHVFPDKEAFLNNVLPHNSLGTALCFTRKFNAGNFSSIVQQENKEKPRLVTLRHEIHCWTKFKVSYLSKRRL